MKRSCPKRNKDIRDKKPPVVRIVEGLDLFNGGDIFLATAKSPGKAYWILNSSCSFHTCSVREYFDTYQACEKGSATWQMAHIVRLLRWEQYRFPHLMA